ncbi:protein lethal(2)denticleless-like [Neocloeon triangulifer]|uniref:protein lethal(2)denticleless-like n=1 Tax=Neocloeon triangulifer TaxID=2078957 RepID=UPI00286ED7C9|nr:protein lethal(2)denticleless-like [Neocloeon triangulifer]XP_059475436.1 protein lethal(2)denticleless-like [Neocloeon triangulifer]
MDKSKVLNVWSSSVDSYTPHKQQPSAPSKASKNEKSIAVKVNCMSFCPFEEFGNFVVLGYSSGKIALAEIGTFGVTVGEEQSTEQQEVGAVAWTKSIQGQILAVSTEREDTLVLWRVKFDRRALRIHMRLLDVAFDCGREVRLCCLATLPAVPNLVATAGQSGIIYVYHKNYIFPSFKINKAHALKAHTSGKSLAKSLGICSLIFMDSTTLISAGVDDMKVKFWKIDYTYVGDGEKNLPMTNMLKMSATICSIALNNTNGLFVSCLDNKIYMYDLSNFLQKHLQTFTGYVAGKFSSISISPCGSYLASGCAQDNCIFIWETATKPHENPPDISPVLKLKGHKSSVQLVDWYRAKNDSNVFKLISASKDGDMRSWRANTDGVKEKLIKGQGCMEILDADYRERLTGESSKGCAFPQKNNQDALGEEAEVAPDAGDQKIERQSVTESAQRAGEVEEKSDESSGNEDETLPDDVWNKLSLMY